MTITYNGKELIQFKAKFGGKNQSEIDGFYRDALDCEHFFIKKPADQRELFAEAFAGAILQEIMDRGLIDKIYHPSLIVARVVRVDDGTGKPEYALIQPMVSFVALHETIETSYADGSDRDPLKEAYAGSDYYLRLLEQQQFGLTNALMFSMWLSAHSVHSGNIVALNNDKMISKQLARLDWGDAFRFLAHPKNNENLLYAYENRGVLNYKRWTKDYFLNYKKIPGLFPEMAEKGRLFKAALQEDDLLDILRSALQKLPVDLIEQQTKDEFAQYANMESFKTVQLGPESGGG
jgi:effector protein B